MMDNLQLEKQHAFVQMLRDGMVLSHYDIYRLFMADHEFVLDVIDITGLDIQTGQRIIDADEDPRVYFLASDTPLDGAGLEEMTLAVDDTQEEDLNEVEYQDGYYLMWTCPKPFNTVDGLDAYCGKFHKVDLGDEKLIRPRIVRCTDCGTQYRIRPKE
jgi:hypothetical protein